MTHAIRHHEPNVGGPEQAKAPHRDGASGRAVGVVVADHHDAGRRFDRIVEQRGRAVEDREARPAGAGVRANDRDRRRIRWRAPRTPGAARDGSEAGMPDRRSGVARRWMRFTRRSRCEPPMVGSGQGHRVCRLHGAQRNARASGGRTMPGNSTATVGLGPARHERNRSPQLPGPLNVHLPSAYEKTGQSPARTMVGLRPTEGDCRSCLPKVDSTPALPGGFPQDLAPSSG